MANSGEPVTDVACMEDKLVVDLADGRTISVPQLGTRAFCMPLLGSVTIGKLLSVALESTGQILTKTSLWRAFFVEHHLRRQRR